MFPVKVEMFPDCAEARARMKSVNFGIPEMNERDLKRLK